ncbi:sugar transferase [Qipengyuania sp. CAU 1752]
MPDNTVPAQVPEDSRFLVKRLVDIVVSFLGLLFLGWLIAICWVIAAIETGSNGFFLQDRIGRHGAIFRIIKIKTMTNRGASDRSSVTTANSASITRSGKIIRRFKLDELPQLINVLKGEMSLVGPRPDIRGFADKLEGEDRIILTLRPGITGPASIKFRDEEYQLSRVADPEAHNRDVIWPAKVAINLDYARNFGFFSDLKYILQTIL